MSFSYFKREDAGLPRLVAASGVLLVAVFLPLITEPDQREFLLFAAAVAVLGAGVWWTSLRFGLQRRALAFVAAVGVFLGLAPQAEFWGTTVELILLLIAWTAGIIAVGLLAWFVHGVHNVLRDGQPPWSLWVAGGLLLASIPVQFADALPVLVYGIPLALLVVPLVRTSRGCRAEAL